MGKINWFKNYLQEVQDSILIAGATPINRNRMVIDDSQLTKYLSEHQSDFNFLLVGVLPDFGSTGTDGDNFMLSASTQFMILEKTSYSEVNYDEFYDIFERAFNVAELVVQKLLNDHLTGACGYLRYLKPNSIQIVPVWNKSSCNGWNVIFSFDAPL